MKTYLLLLFLLFFAAQKPAAQINWQSTNGPEGADGSPLYSNDQYVFYSDAYSSYRSSDGANWETFLPGNLWPMAILGSKIVAKQGVGFGISPDGPKFVVSNDNGDTWMEAVLPPAKATSLIDAAVMYLGLVFLKDFWANYYYKDPGYFETDIFWFNFPLYTLVWLMAVWLNGGYDDRFDLRRLLRGIAFGSLALAAIYGFLDESHRTSRALLVLGAGWAAASLTGLRLLLHFLKYRHFRIGRERARNLVIAGSAPESSRVQALLNQVPLPKNIIGTVSPWDDTDDSTYLSSLSQLDDVVRIYRVDEVIFCSRDVPAHDIMAWMTRLGPAVSYKIVPEESLSIIGSSDKNAPGELYTIDIRYNIAQPGERRNKRFLDLLLCLLLLVTAPLVLLFSKKRKPFAEGFFPVLLGKKTWVGYAPHPQNSALPKLKPGVFSPVDALEGLPATPNTVERLNFLYAKDWQMGRDLEVVLSRQG